MSFENEEAFDWRKLLNDWTKVAEEVEDENEPIILFFRWWGRWAWHHRPLIVGRRPRLTIIYPSFMVGSPLIVGRQVWLTVIFPARWDWRQCFFGHKAYAGTPHC